MTTPTPAPTGLIAILRGLTPQDAPAAGAALRDAGIRAIEVTLNSPDPYRSIRVLQENVSPRCVVGAGTVLTAAEVRAAFAAGAQMIVSPNTDTSVIAETVRLGMRSFPGAATPSEAIAAIAVGARAVKVFPAAQVGVAGLKAWTAVLPAGIELIPVGGVDAADFPAWVAAGATGFGIGSALYSAGTPASVLTIRARALLSAWQSAGEPFNRRSAR